MVAAATAATLSRRPAVSVRRPRACDPRDVQDQMQHAPTTSAQIFMRSSKR